MNETDHEILVMMRSLGTATWTPTPKQTSVAGWLYQMLYIEFILMDGMAVYEPSEAFVRMVNASPARAHLLDERYWKTVKDAGLLRKHVLKTVACMDLKNAVICIDNRLNPVEYLEMVSDGTPAEYAIQATRLM